jgi:uncharacterized protein
METKPVHFVPHGNNSPEVIERRKVVDANAFANMERINARLVPHVEEFNARMQDIFDWRLNGGALRYAIPMYWQLLDDMMSYNGDDVACKRGCNHCCHICALIPEEEARVIGDRIHIEPKKVKARNNGKGFDFGYHNPCTFLKNGECSIYEHRPVTCRVHYSLDIDSLMCELTPPEIRDVPYMNPMNFHMAFLQLLGVPKRVPKLADIRDFFPSQK